MHLIYFNKPQSFIQVKAVSSLSYYLIHFIKISLKPYFNSTAVLNFNSFRLVLVPEPIMAHRSYTLLTFNGGCNPFGNIIMWQVLVVCSHWTSKLCLVDGGGGNANISFFKELSLINFLLV